jgi:hypothetical protein
MILVCPIEADAYVIADWWFKSSNQAVGYVNVEAEFPCGSLSAGRSITSDTDLRLASPNPWSDSFRVGPSNRKFIFDTCAEKNLGSPTWIRTSVNARGESAADESYLVGRTVSPHWVDAA